MVLNKGFTLGLIAALTASVLLSGCGRNGAPLRPSEAAIEQAKEEERPAPAAPTPNVQNQEKRFILDGLLE